MSLKIINLTPNKPITLLSPKTPIRKEILKGREVNIADIPKEDLNDYVIKRFYPVGIPVLVNKVYTMNNVTTVNDLPLVKDESIWDIQNLPPRRKNTIYIVSNIAARAIAETHPNRTDFIFPSYMVAVKHNNGTFSTVGTMCFGYYGQ